MDEDSELQPPQAGEWWVIEEPKTQARAVGYCVTFKGELAWELLDYMTPIPLDRRVPIRRVNLEE